MQVKNKTRVDNVSTRNSDGCLKSTECSTSGMVKDVKGASLAFNHSERQSRSEKLPSVLLGTGETEKVTSQTYVGVVGRTGKPLMPCTPARARELVRKSRAKRRFSKGIFYIQMGDRKNGTIQKIGLGIDTGSKREAFTVKTEKHTVINILSDAISWVKKKIETRKYMRKSRRFRKTPCRKNRSNRARGGIPHSTFTRWNVKMNIVKMLCKLYPVSNIIVEDINAKTKKGKKKWNNNFSPLEVGKLWFYNNLRLYGELSLKQGYDTKELRDNLGLIKSKGKLEEKFSAHNVDSWVLANSIFTNDVKPDNTKLHRLIPIRFTRRQLHKLQPSKTGFRKREGGTMSLGFKKGSLCKHKKLGLTYVGGNSNNRLSLHDIYTGNRLTRSSLPKDIEIFCFNSWKYTTRT